MNYSSEYNELIPSEWNAMCDVPTSAFDVASGARAVKAFLYYDKDALPLEGFAVLVSSHLLVLDDFGGQPIFWLAMHAVEGMRCAVRVMIPGKSFGCSSYEEVSLETGDAEGASRVVTMDFFSSAATVSLKVTGVDCEQFARAALLLWHFQRKNDVTDQCVNECEDSSVALLHESSVWHRGDVLYACAGAPVRLSAILVQHPTDLPSGTAVDLVMVDAEKLCIVRKPLAGNVYTRQAVLLSTEVERLVLSDFALLSLRAHTSLRLVDRSGAVWAFEIADDAATQHTTRRLAELCLVGLLRRCPPGAERGLRHGDIAGLHRQYIALDPAGAGYAPRTALEEAVGPLLACDARLMAAVCGCCCESDTDNDQDGSHDAATPSARIRLASYVSGMRVLLQGNIAERAAVAFRAFAAASESEAVGLDQTVQPADFQRTAEDILAGLRLADRAAALIASIPSDPMPFGVFRNAYEKLVAVVFSAEQEPAVPKVSSLSLGFGSEHWVQLTFLMTGIEVASLTACGDEKRGLASLDPSSYVDKRTFDISQPSETIASSCDAPLLSLAGMATSFFRKRIPQTQNDRATFSAFASSVFVLIRRRFGFSEESYVDALGIRALRARLLLGQLCSPRDIHSSGRSGSLLLSSHDGKFVLKTILRAESHMLRRNLPLYVMHVQRHSHTLLPRYSGLYSLIRNGEKKVYVVAENIFAPAQCSIAEVYDLKGSSIHRTTDQEDRLDGAAGKDNDFIEEKRRLRLSSEAREALLAQLDADTALLEKCNALDYSLLVGIHRANGSKEISEGAEARQAQREQLNSVAAMLHANSGYNDDNKTTDVFAGIDVESQAQSTHQLEINLALDGKEQENKSFTELAQPSAFRAYRGGLASADGSEIYYLGFVDCLTAYGLKKVGEHYCKSMILLDMKRVSCVPPPVYRTRFMEFIRSVISEDEGV